MYSHESYLRNKKRIYEYQQRPDIVARRCEYEKKRGQTTKRKKYMQEYRRSEKRKAKNRLYMLEYNVRDEVKRRNNQFKSTESYKNYCRKYYQRPDVRASKRAQAVLTHRLRSLRVPKWADLEAIKQFYKNCPDGMTVDHIIPLLGKTVSGMHVLSNLQYLPFVDNVKKGNKFNASVVQLERTSGL